MTIYSSRRTTQPFQKAPVDYDLRQAIYDRFDKYQADKTTKDRLSETSRVRADLANKLIQGLRERVPEAENMTFLNALGGDYIAAWNDPKTPDQRSFFTVDVDDNDVPSLIPAFSLPEASFSTSLSALNADYVDKKTLAGLVPQFGALDPAVVEAVRNMYDESEGKYTPKAIYARMMTEPVWDLDSIAAVPGRETAPKIGRIPAMTRVRYRTKGEVPADAVPVEEEVKEEVKTEEPKTEKPAEPVTKSASDLFTDMRNARKSRTQVVTDDAGNVDIVKSSTSSLFKSRMRGNR